MRVGLTFHGRSSNTHAPASTLYLGKFIAAGTGLHPEPYNEVLSLPMVPSVVHKLLLKHP